MSVLARRACSGAAALARSLERRLALLGGSAPVVERQSELPFDIALDDAEPGAVLGVDGLDDPSDERMHLRRLIDLAHRAATAESKLSALRRLVVRANEPVVVFTDYRDTLDVLATTLPGFDTVQLHGGLSSRERAQVLDRFTAGTARVLLATDAASEGLNLHQRCRFVVTLELPWTPVRMEQRAGRVDRIGQSRTVHVVHLVARETCEETTLARLVRRITRIRDTLCVASPVHDERRIADAVLGDEPAPDVDAAPRTRSVGMSTIDLRREALAEARRVTKARTLLDERSPSSTDMRGVIAHLGRRRNRRGRQCIWTFTVTVASTSGQVLWEPLVTLATDIDEPIRPVRRDTRRYLAHAHPSVTAALRSAQGALLDRLRDDIRRPAALWRLRELELMEELRHRDARLSAGLLQRSLFDRRGERATAAQAALLEAALAASAQRVAELESLDALDIESCRLAFAAVIP